MAGQPDWLGFFKEEIVNEDQRVRLDAVSRSALVANAIGPRRTVDELIPYLFDLTKNNLYLNDDEFLFRTGEQ